jgi:hypothetical protein
MTQPEEYGGDNIACPKRSTAELTILSPTPIDEPGKQRKQKQATEDLLVDSAIKTHECPFPDWNLRRGYKRKIGEIVGKNDYERKQNTGNK